MTRASRFLTACTSCRRLKRRCDYMKLGHGPCSNCVQRKIGHLCSIDVDESDEKDDLLKSEQPVMQGIMNPIVNDTDEEESIHSTTISYRRKRRRGQTTTTTINPSSSSSSSAASSSMPQSQQKHYSLQQSLDSLQSSHQPFQAPLQSNIQSEGLSFQQNQYQHQQSQKQSSPLSSQSQQQQNTHHKNTSNRQPSPDSSNSIYSKISPKLLSTCVVKFFQNPEWSFFLNEDVLMHAVVERHASRDFTALSLLYVMSACIILRRGIQVSTASDFKGNRLSLAAELFAAHLKCSEGQNTYTLLNLQAMVLRSHYYLHMEMGEKAWEALYQAMGIYNALPAPPKDMDDGLHQLEGKRAEYDRTWVALCCLETTLCSVTNRRGTLLLLSKATSSLPKNIPMPTTTNTGGSSSRNTGTDTTSTPTLVNNTTSSSSSSMPTNINTPGSTMVNSYSGDVISFDYDFKLNRRWKVLWFYKECQVLIDCKVSPRTMANEFNSLEKQILNYIQLVDDQEGKLFPYGQLALYGCLIKLCTQNVLGLIREESDATNSAFEVKNEIVEMKNSVMSRVVSYGQALSSCLYSLAVSSVPPALGSAPFLAMYVFQSLTCIWIQAALAKHTAVNEYNKFEEVKTNLLTVLESLREDKSICKRTTILFHGLDVLSNMRWDDQDPYNVMIPIQLQGGLTTVSKAWDDERLRLKANTSDVWSSFQPFTDDNLFWSTLTAHAAFDYSASTLQTDPIENDLYFLR